MEKVKLDCVWLDQVNKGQIHVAGRDADGRIYTHFFAFRSDRYADRLMKRVIDSGFMINPEHWNCYIPYGTEAWLLDGMEVTLMDEQEKHHKGLI